MDLVEHPFDAVEDRFERPLRHETTMEHEGEPHAQVGGAARRHGQHHGVDPGPRGRGPQCLFCGEPARAFKPLDEGALATLKRLWWCRPCETTGVA